MPVINQICAAPRKQSREEKRAATTCKLLLDPGPITLRIGFVTLDIDLSQDCYCKRKYLVLGGKSLERTYSRQHTEKW